MKMNDNNINNADITFFGKSKGHGYLMQTQQVLGQLGIPPPSSAGACLSMPFKVFLLPINRLSEYGLWFDGGQKAGDIV